MARSEDQLSKRERQLMDVVYRVGRCTAQEALEGLDDPPGYSSVRTILGILVEKGLLKRKRDGRAYVYEPVAPVSRARKQALGRVLETFFENSPEGLVAALLDMRSRELSDDELARLERLIEDAKRKGQS